MDCPIYENLLVILLVIFTNKKNVKFYIVLASFFGSCVIK